MAGGFWSSNRRLAVYFPGYGAVKHKRQIRLPLQPNIAMVANAFHRWEFKWGVAAMPARN
jgi:hypothetical protein